MQPKLWFIDIFNWSIPMKERILFLLSLLCLAVNVYADIPAGYYNKAVGKKMQN